MLNIDWLMDWCRVPSINPAMIDVAFAVQCSSEITILVSISDDGSGNHKYMQAMRNFQNLLAVGEVDLATFWTASQGYKMRSRLEPDECGGGSGTRLYSRCRPEHRFMEIIRGLSRQLGKAHDIGTRCYAGTFELWRHACWPSTRHGEYSARATTVHPDHNDEEFHNMSYRTHTQGINSGISQCLEDNSTS